MKRYTHNKTAHPDGGEALREVVARVLDQYALDPRGAHGVGHWARVLENGRKLARSTGANVQVVELFAVLHDACRLNEARDREHGLRGAELAKSMNGSLFNLAAEDLGDLYAACAYHTTGRRDGTITVQTCWDADRLDLGRVGIRPLSKRLCTEAARSPKMLKWASGRGKERYVEPWVRSEWGVDIA